MAVQYFEFPQMRGDVYKVEVGHADNVSVPVLLPNGTLVYLKVKKGWFAVATEKKVQQTVPAGVRKAKLIFREKQAVQKFWLWWGSGLIEKINAAAAVNTLLSVRLPMWQYRRLAAGGFEKLKIRLSERAQNFIRLEKDTWNGGGPALELLREGRCP